MEHGLEIENVGRRGPLSTAVTWPLADGPSVSSGLWRNFGKMPANVGQNLATFDNFANVGNKFFKIGKNSAILKQNFEL